VQAAKRSRADVKVERTMLCRCTSPHSQRWMELVRRTTAGIPSLILASSCLVSHQRETRHRQQKSEKLWKPLDNAASELCPVVLDLIPTSNGLRPGFAQPVGKVVVVLLEKRLANRFSNNTIGNDVCQA
jgi:hypothetical protein